MTINSDNTRGRIIYTDDNGAEHILTSGDGTAVPKYIEDVCQAFNTAHGLAAENMTMAGVKALFDSWDLSTLKAKAAEIIDINWAAYAISAPVNLYGDFASAFKKLIEVATTTTEVKDMLDNIFFGGELY